MCEGWPGTPPCDFAVLLYSRHNRANVSMEELKADVAIVKKALFGDPADPKKMPGVITELANVEREVKTTNEILRKIMWMVLAAVIGGLL